MTYKEEYGDRYYSGWAPCAHTPEKKSILEKEYLLNGVTLEDLAWELNIGLLSSPRLDADQWVGTSTEVYDMKNPWMIYIQADSFLLALTETVIQVVLHKFDGLWEPQIQSISLALEGHNPPKWASFVEDVTYEKRYKVSPYSKD